MAGRKRFVKDLIADLRDIVERPRFLAGLVLTLIGAVVVATGLAGALLVGPSSTWTATRTVTPAAPAVVVTPGVLGAIGPQVTVAVRRADGKELFVGRAISSDVDDLTGTTPRLLVSGVHPVRRLSVSVRPGTTALPPVRTSDIWRESSIGAGERTLTWRPDTEPQSVLIATTDGAALPTLRLSVSWHRSGWFPLAVLIVLLGLMLLTAGLHRLTGGHVVHRLLDRVLAPATRIPVPARRVPARRRTGEDSEVVR